MSVPENRAASRATPLPEERGTAPDAEEILRESEERVAGAARGERPADDADEHRRSEETL
ncbi:hypothetical protein [Pseudonocardia spirodelae]|uniref:Nucleotide exchange factor GrpE n=1 Tax=Pseudonocardia spirodelae TaxID=3133431 RepID=A0ABU8TB15_9PSEU